LSVAPATGDIVDDDDARSWTDDPPKFRMHRKWGASDLRDVGLL